MRHLPKAFTLIELLISIAMIAILLGYAIPGFGGFLEKRKVDANTQRLVQTLRLSRTTAVTDNILVTICPTANGQQCSSNWSDGYMSFSDFNGDRKLNNQDQILFAFVSNDNKSIISWRAFGVRSSLQWLQTGITNHQNGSFELCYDNKAKLARGLFITKAGRVRFSKDNNGDNIHESATGGVIDC